MVTPTPVTSARPRRIERRAGPLHPGEVEGRARLMAYCRAGGLVLPAGRRDRGEQERILRNEPTAPTQGPPDGTGQLVPRCGVRDAVSRPSNEASRSTRSTTPAGWTGATEAPRAVWRRRGSAEPKRFRSRGPPPRETGAGEAGAGCCSGAERSGTDRAR